MAIELDAATHARDIKSIQMLPWSKVQQQEENEASETQRRGGE
jgi:hypothetical protein